ncbi:MAG: LytR/AlgR family response regulator transcription factor [Bacteroidia bacterium]
MNVIIIEDEQYTAEDLKKNITKASPDINIQATLTSVKEATDYLKINPHPDLFFSDIQLGDGLSFEIFKIVKISAPVIFITAFDEYALKAFQANGVDYILKPFSFKTIADALKKFNILTTSLSEENKIDKLLNYLQASQEKQNSILVYIKDKIIPVNGSDIALFYTENYTVKVFCFDGRQFKSNFTLEELENIMGADFFRANRQHIVNRIAITDATQYFARKLLINLKIDYKEKIIISKEKTPSFLNWLSRS